MSAPVSVTINRDDIARIKRDFLLMDNEVPLAQSRVINRTLTAINAEGVVQVRKQYNLKATRIRKNFSVRRATKNNLSGRWQSRGEPIGLINFGAQKRNKGVSVRVSTGSKREIVPHSFIQVGKNNVKHVFWREKKGGVMVGRYDINRLTGPRIEDALASTGAQKALQTKADQTIQVRLAAEANYILSKAK